MENNCMFQYATNNKIIDDTDLITKDEAINLWFKYKEDFIKRLKNSEDPEMCIWVNCGNNSHYGENIMHVDSDSFIKGGDIYIAVKVG